MLTQSELPKSIRDTSFFYASEMSKGSSCEAYNQGASGMRPNQKFQVSKLARSIPRDVGHLGQPDPVF